MKISDDQNFVEVNGVKGEFVEKMSYACVGCCFRDFDDCVLTKDSSIILLCAASFRKDRKDGYFKEVK